MQKVSDGGEVEEERIQMNWGWGSVVDDKVRS